MNKAIFLDLDGTLIQTKSGETFPKDNDDWKFKDKVVDIVKGFTDKGFIPIIVSNQGGIEAGFVKQEEFDNKLDIIRSQISEYLGVDIHGAYCSLGESYFRKPNPGMAYRMAIDLELNLRNSIMVGDMESDRKFAKNAYIGTYYDIDDFIKTHTEC